MNNTIEFKIRFVQSTEIPKDVKVLNIHESLGGLCRVYSTHLEFLDYRYGVTKHLSLFLGGLFGWILKPLLGSLTVSISSYKILWKDVQSVKFVSSVREINVLGKREKDKHLWLFTFKCEQDNELLSQLSSFTNIEAI